MLLLHMVQLLVELALDLPVRRPPQGLNERFVRLGDDFVLQLQQGRLGVQRPVTQRC